MSEINWDGFSTRGHINMEAGTFYRQGYEQATKDHVRQRDELVDVLKEMIAISDRDHDVWNRAKQAIAKVKGEV